MMTTAAHEVHSGARVSYGGKTTMTDATRYRDGTASSTALMQDAMENQALSVSKGEGKKVDWHADAETMDRARARMHDEPTEIVGHYGGQQLDKQVHKLVKKEAMKAATPLIEK